MRTAAAETAVRTQRLSEGETQVWREGSIEGRGLRARVRQLMTADGWCGPWRVLGSDGALLDAFPIVDPAEDVTVKIPAAPREETAATATIDRIASLHDAIVRHEHYDARAALCAEAILTMAVFGLERVLKSLRLV